MISEDQLYRMFLKAREEMRKYGVTEPTPQNFVIDHEHRFMTQAEFDAFTQRDLDERAAYERDCEVDDACDGDFDKDEAESLAAKLAIRYPDYDFEVEEDDYCCRCGSSFVVRNSRKLTEADRLASITYASPLEVGYYD